MTRQRKPLPADNYQNLFYPPAGYQYFEGGDQPENAFHPDSAQFELINAWWMADAALMAYEQDFEKVRGRLESLGLQAVQVGDWGGGHRGTQAFAAFGERFALVSFRGTEKQDVQDTLSDLEVTAVPEGGCLVHRGFKSALDQVWESVQSLLAERAKPSIFFTGHSLGAALATLAAFRWVQPAALSLFTFGSPRVGNTGFCNEVWRKTQGRSYRFVNNDDIVTLVPAPSASYDHVQREMYIDSAGRLNSELASKAHWRDAIGAALRHDITELGHLVTHFELVPPYLAGNHSPGRYPVLIWNNLCEAGLTAGR